MAVLKDLIVYGPSRFLNVSYFNKLSADEVETSKLIAKNATLTNATVVGLLDVSGELHTKSFTNSNIATIDGSFYITPTLGLQGSDSDKNMVAITATSLSFSHSGGTNFNFENLYISGSTSTVAWTTGSSVIVTGEILSTDGEWIPLGTLKGTLSTYTTTSVVINNLKDSNNNTAPATLATLAGQSGRKYRKIKVSLVSINRSGLKPLGIYMTAMGANGKTFLDIYGGNNAESTTYAGLSTPVVRIGNLQGLPQIQNVSPTGWGIYTTNGFFSGMVVADRGKIGGWNIGTDTNKSLYTNTFNTSGGIYISPSYSGVLTIAGNTSKNWAFTAGANFGVTTDGMLYASGAEISGNIAATTGSISNSVTIGGVAASTVLSNIEAASETASKYISADSTGIMIYDGTNGVQTPSSPNTDTQNVFIDANSLDIRKGTTVLATFGSDGAQIGITDGPHTNINAGGMQVYSSRSIKLADINYGEGQSTSGLANAPFYTFGSRKSGSTVGNYSMVQGLALTASGYCSHAEGVGSTASGYNSHAEGDHTIASGQESHAEGGYYGALDDNPSITTASGMYSHAEGAGAIASDTASHAEGIKTTASERSAHAEGYETTASGMASHAEGYETTASGVASHAGGHETIAGYADQLVIGRLNDNQNNTAFEIGNGSSSGGARSNAFTVDWEGNVNIPLGAKYKIRGVALSASDVSAVPTTRTVNSKALSTDITLSASDVSAVPTTRTVNSKALSSDITLSASDVGAVSDVQLNGSSLKSGTVANLVTASLIDIFYPVGSYYETSDTSFDPNTAWGGTWVQELAGQVHVSSGTGYSVSGALTNASDGGSTDAIVPYHKHTATDGAVTDKAAFNTNSSGAVTNGITGGSHSHNQQGWYGVTAGGGGTVKECRARNKITSDASDTSTNISSTHTHNLPNHTHSIPAHGHGFTQPTISYAGTNGNTVNANMQPYIVVNRWHRTA